MLLIYYYCVLCRKFFRVLITPQVTVLVANPDFRTFFAKTSTSVRRSSSLDSISSPVISNIAVSFDQKGAGSRHSRIRG